MKKIAAALVLLAALALAACGGGGGDTTATSTGSSGVAKPAGASGSEGQGPQSQGQGQGEQGQGQGDRDQARGEAQGGGKRSGGSKGVPGDTSAGFTPPSHSDSGGGAEQFETKAGDNSIQEFGSEGGSSDFAAAATALHGYLDARAAHAWEAACSYMSPGIAASLAQLSGGSGKGMSCAEAVAGLSAGVPDATLREASEADAAALRIEGARAFLLFRGAHGTDYFMPMASEGGTWKVAAIAASALP